jgi:hypothetical protein
VSPGGQECRRVVFVCPAATGESLRAAHAIKDLDDVCLLGITEHEADVFEDAIQVTNVHDADQLIAAAHRHTDEHGRLSHIITAQETLLEPVAKAREALNISGMTVETVRRALDKSQLKDTLRRAGINTPPDQLITDHKGIQTGFPLLLKPLSGSGALATLLIRNKEALEQALELMRPSLDHPLLAEAYLGGQELCFDTITINNEPQLYSICCYYPSILEALEHSEIQWTCVLPRDIDVELYQDFIKQGLAAVRALSVGNSMTHMEGFIDSDGAVLGFTDATLRPAGARIGPMLGFAYDVDPHRVWARVAVDGCFDGPWERKYSVGTIFLRGEGSGVIEQIDGVEIVNRQLAGLLVDARWPTAGATKSHTYTGDGYVTLRHENTEEVKTALQFIADTVRISYSATESSLEWKDRFLNYKELNKPAWETHSKRRHL